MINIAEKIKAIRADKKLKQREIAEKIGVSINGYQKIESGETDVNFSRLQQIADVFQMSVVDIINYPNVSVAGTDSEEFKELKNHLFHVHSFMNDTNQDELELVRLIFKYIQQQEIDVEGAYQKAKEEWYEENIEKLRGIFKNVENNSFYLKIKTMKFSEFNDEIILKLQKLIAKIISNN